MTDQEYIQFLSGFSFSQEQLQILLAIPIRISDEGRQSLRLVLDAVEKEIRTYRFDLRSYKIRKPPILKYLRDAIEEAEPVKDRIEALVKEHRYIDAFRYHDGWLMNLSKELDGYTSLLQSVHDFISASVIGGASKPGGRPFNQYRFMFALAVGRNLKIHGFKLSKSRNSLFYQLYGAILEMLQVEIQDPYNYIVKACDYLVMFEPSPK
jgi:hypothetical protein